MPLSHGTGGGAFSTRRMTAAMAAACALLAYGAAGEWLRGRDLDAELARKREQVAGMEARNEELRRQGQTVSSQEMLEREARLKLNLQKPGEEVVIVRLPDRGGEAVAPPEAAVPNPGKWWRYFFK